MAAKKRAQKNTTPGPDVGGVSREEFNTLASSVGDLVGLVKQALEKPPTAPTVEKIAEEKEIAKATANKVTVNPEWDDLAREIIGPAVDHTEIEYVKGGGMKFTIVIKNDFSNAPADYLSRHKVDRRSREVGAEGEAGVRIWCQLVRDNLKRPRNVSSE